MKPFISASTSCFSGRALHALLLLVPTRAYADAGVDVRGTDAFYAVQRRLHNAVAAVRIGKELHLTDGTW